MRTLLSLAEKLEEDLATSHAELTTDEPVILPASLEDLLEKAHALEKWPLARLISMFEGTHLQQREHRRMIIRYLRQNRGRFPETACVIGFTGTPGAGKSSLIGEVCLQLLRGEPNISVAILAVDPSSHSSGGALLGDRTRVNLPTHEKRIFFRSQASHLELGGVSHQTFQATRILRYFFDYIFVETVGIGQSEIEVQQVSDHTCLIMQPMTGDHIQFMKCGIMEIPDTFVINKCDEDVLAKQSYHLLASSLKLARIGPFNGEHPQTPIFLTSALKRTGIELLTRHLIAQKKSYTPDAKDEYYLKKWITTTYGLWGLSIYEIWKQSHPETVSMTYEEQEDAFQKHMDTKIHGR